MSWSELPTETIAKIFSFIPQVDTFQIALSCRNWFDVFRAAVNFQHFEVDFTTAKLVECQKLWIQQNSFYVLELTIKINQSDLTNRQNALELIGQLDSERFPNLKKIRIIFTGENPLFYSGKEFSDALEKLSIQLPQNQIEEIDLGRLQILFQDSLVASFMSQSFCENLKSLNLQNKQLICNISQNLTECLVSCCRNLVDLRVFHSCMSDHVLAAFAANDHAPPQHISMLCRRSDKLQSIDLTSAAWLDLCSSSPSLKITLKFDHTCTTGFLRHVMKPEIPIVGVHIESYRHIADQLQLVTDRCESLLQALVVRTQPSDELDRQLLKVCATCRKLSSLHVLCIVAPTTIGAILCLRPALAQTGRYTLKDDMYPPSTFGIG